MSPEEFERTPADRMAAYYTAWREEQRRRDLRIGVAACTLANMLAAKGQRALQPHDLYASLPKPAPPGPEALAAKLMALGG